jgi:hypothetical protein
MSNLLKKQSTEAFGLKNIIPGAARLGLIEDSTPWFTYAQAKNESSLIYRKDDVLTIYTFARAGFFEDVSELTARVEEGSWGEWRRVFLFGMCYL